MKDQENIYKIDIAYWFFTEASFGSILMNKNGVIIPFIKKLFKLSCGLDYAFTSYIERPLQIVAIFSELAVYTTHSIINILKILY